MGSALLNTPLPDPADCELAIPSHASAPAPHEALRLQVAERLAAHRNRRNQLHPAPPTLQSTAPSTPTTRSARIAATVAERYAHSLSYRAFLAAEAERATQQARAAAEVAERNAQAVAQAEQQLLSALYAEAQAEAAYKQAHAEQLTLATDLAGPSSPVSLEIGVPASFADGVKRAGYRANARPSSPARATHSKPSNNATKPTHAESSTSGLTVRLYEGAAPASPLLPPPSALTPRYGTRPPNRADEDEARALDEEITFRQAPVFEEPAGPPMPLPANLIEFPRQLVAPRKVRPRYAEGPLREEDTSEPGGSQLRIFEVEAAQISTTPEVAETPTPQWTSLWLDAPNFTPNPISSPAEATAAVTDEYAAALAVADPLLAPYATIAPRRYPASIPRRLKAAAIDICFIGTGFLASAATVAAIGLRSTAAQPGHQLLALARAAFTSNTGLQPGILLAAIATGLVFLHLLYQFLFFSFSEATPGMRYARIALCTFTDDNPTRRAMRRRIFAVLLSACPLGLGLLWAMLDEDRLTWHDLVTRTYQRSY